MSDPLYTATRTLSARPMATGADVAAYGAENVGPLSGDMWDDPVATLIRLDDDGDDMESLKDELDMFRRENDFDLD